MVCDKCLEKQKKEGKTGTIVPDRWKEGAANWGKADSSDKRITKKELHNPYTKRKKERYCKICKQDLPEGHYCSTCAFKKGICKMCGKKVVDTKLEYKSTNA